MTPTATTDILTELRTAIANEEITATEIATACGVSISTVTRALKGEVDPPHSRVIRYREVLLSKRAAR